MALLHFDSSILFVNLPEGDWTSSYLSYFIWGLEDSLPIHLPGFHSWGHKSKLYQKSNRCHLSLSWGQWKPRDHPADGELKEATLAFIVVKLLLPGGTVVFYPLGLWRKLLVLTLFIMGKINNKESLPATRPGWNSEWSVQGAVESRSSMCWGRPWEVAVVICTLRSPGDHSETSAWAMLHSNDWGCHSEVVSSFREQGWWVSCSISDGWWRWMPPRVVQHARFPSYNVCFVLFVLPEWWWGNRKQSSNLE